jgi:serine/threonine protein kinase
MDPVFTIKDDFSMGIQIGQGAFATVLKSTHKKTGYEVALKTYEKKLLTHRSQLMAIHREIYILAGMEHPNIMRLFEVLDNSTRCHLVMEYCRGKNLH